MAKNIIRNLLLLLSFLLVLSMGIVVSSDNPNINNQVYNCKKYTDKQIILSYKNVTEYNKYEDCKTWVMKEKGECVFDLKADRTETYKNGTCVQCFNVTESYIVVTPVYGTEKICEIQNRDGIELTDGYINFTKLNVVGNVKNNVLTMKDLSRGGSFKDHNLDECYNEGVPCTQIKLDTLKYISLVKDDDKISIEKEIEEQKPTLSDSK